MEAFLSARRRGDFPIAPARPGKPAEPVAATDARIFGAYPNSGGWDITLRNGEDVDATGQTLAPIEKMAFMFLCVPTNTPGLIGGHINGATGA